MGSRCERGLTLVELLIALAISAVLLSSLGRLFVSALAAQEQIQVRVELNQRARFALNRIVDAVQSTHRLILPLGDRTNTGFNENIRIQTVPASAPEPGSTLATAVLAVALPAASDLDLDGKSDADNDDDGRIDEDWSGDATNDGANGIVSIDDNGDGTADAQFGSSSNDDDEYFNFPDEDALNGIDDDGDGSIDEDPGRDMNGDRAPGIENVDDDGDGSVDEGDDADDDEDGMVDEDWLDPLVFYLVAGDLIERRAVPFDTNADAMVDGRDYLEETIAKSVTLVRFERVVSAVPMVDIELALTEAGVEVRLRTVVRVGALP